MIGKIDSNNVLSQAEKCAKCDDGKCTECDCNTGGTCVDASKCTPDSCAPSKDKYSCNWSASPPQCVIDPNGQLDKPSCTEECHSAQYGKCNFDTNKCEVCTPGGDPDCLYLMTYCAAIQKEGKCTREAFTGLYRMIQSRIGYESGEYDVEFKGGKMYIQSYKTAKTGNGFGEIKVDVKTQTFTVSNWVGDDKIWPKDKMYGVYK